MKQRKGFAVLRETDPKRMKEIASLGGKAVPPAKRTFKTNPDLARIAGQKGGMTAKRPRSR
jgi:general stress protein YciG